MNDFGGFLLLILIILGVIVAFLSFMDSKKDYQNDKLPLDLYNLENGKQCFGIDIWIWQINKEKEIKNRYTQNTILDVNGFAYIIVSYIGCFPSFLSKQYRFGCEPITTQTKQIIQNITITISDSNNINIKLDNAIDCSQVFNEIKNNIDNKVDQDELLSIIDSVSKKESINKENASKFYTLLQKYEPVLSCASNLISVLSELVKYFV